MWKDKVVIITGSSIGIGRRLALEIGKRGGKIVLNARNGVRLDKTCAELEQKGIQVSAFPGDVSDYTICSKIVAHTLSEFGRLDVLINNAGISTQASLEEISPELFKKVVEVNYLGPVFMTQLAIPHLKKTKGSVLFIGSVAAIHGLGNFSAYSSSKMALTGLAESLSKEMKISGVHVGIAYVGFTQNDPEKTMYDKDGQLIPQPPRSFKQESTEKVALRLMNMIEHRKFKSVFTPLGKLNALMNRISPTLVHLILQKNTK